MDASREISNPANERYISNLGNTFFTIGLKKLSSLIMYAWFTKNIPNDLSVTDRMKEVAKKMHPMFRDTFLVGDITDAYGHQYNVQQLPFEVRKTLYFVRKEFLPNLSTPDTFIKIFFDVEKFNQLNFIDTISTQPMGYAKNMMDANMEIRPYFTQKWDLYGVCRNSDILHYFKQVDASTNKDIQPKTAVKNKQGHLLTYPKQYSALMEDRNRGGFERTGYAVFLFSGKDKETQKCYSYYTSSMRRYNITYQNLFTGSGSMNMNISDGTLLGLVNTYMFKLVLLAIIKPSVITGEVPLKKITPY